MKTKNKVGVLVILGGLALIGIYWFKKNKPTIGQSQAKGLEALSNFYKTGGTDDEYIKGYKAPTTSQSSIGSFISVKESKAIGDSINCGGDGMLGRLAGIDCTEYCKKYPNDCKYTPNTSGGIFSSQMTQNLQSADFSSLSNLGLAGLDFSNIKLK
jgi:hypothetical protein